MCRIHSVTMGKAIKDAVKGNYAFWICLIVAIFLIVGGTLTPPLFSVEASIFKAVGWLFAFAALGSFTRALDKGMDASIQKGDFTFNVGKKKDE